MTLTMTLALSAGLGLLCLPAPPTTAPAPAGGAPVCDAGPQVFLECNGPMAVVQLDGTGSFDPGGLPLTYSWKSNNCPGYMFDDPTSATPIITFPIGDPCLFECGAIRLTVSNGTQQSECGTAIFVSDTLPPTLDCPDDVLLGEGDSTDPADTGMATAVDLCDPTPVVTFVDMTTILGTTTIVTRVWTAVDQCGNGDSCTQTLTIEEKPETGEAALDIKPGSCPNPVETQSGGLLPVGLLGTSGFDVTQVDTSTLLLARTDGVGGAVSPVKIGFSDVGTPFDGELCDCHTLTGDGLLDLNLKFKKAEVISALLLEAEPAFSYLQLTLTGELLDGTPFAASDCIRVQ